MGSETVDRAALVERMAEASFDRLMGRKGRERRWDSYWGNEEHKRAGWLQGLSDALAVVEAAGWGPLPMPIRTILDAPELMAEEERAMQDLSGPRAEPVAADRAALVERVKADIEMFLGDWLDASYGPYDQLANLSVSAVEAAGWGPRAEPPEPLSVGEFDDIAIRLAGLIPPLEPVVAMECRESIEEAKDHLRFVLAKLPPRHAVPVEGV